jgi:hypothetical protein
MTTKTPNTPRIKGITGLKKFMKGIPAYTEGKRAGLEDYFLEHQDDAELPNFSNDLYSVFECLDTIECNTFFLIAIRLDSLSTHLDNFLFSYDLRQRESKAFLSRNRNYLKFMEPTDRLLIEVQETMLDIFAFTAGLYGIKASLMALKQYTGIKEFEFLDKKILKLEPSKIDPAVWDYTKAKAECRKSKEYRIEDYLNAVLIAMRELNERGYKFTVEPFDPVAFRPTQNTIDNIIRTRRFFGMQKYDYSDNLIYFCHDEYFKQINLDFMRISEAYNRLQKIKHPE